MKESTVKSIREHLDTRAEPSQGELPEDSLSPSEEQGVVAEYRLRLTSLMIIKQLMHLCRDTQKHRGLGMGLLAGNQEFSPRFVQLQQQIARRIQVLYVFSQEPQNPFGEGDLSKIHEAWGTIREGWHDDSVLENFQFHNYFIEQLFQMVSPLTHCLQSAPTQKKVPAMALLIDPLSARLQDELLNFICHQLPRMIEFLGMVRALSSHSATVGHHIKEHDKKLKYLCQCVQSEKLQVINIAEKLHQSIGGDIPSLLVLQTYAFKVDAFIDKVLVQVIGQEKITLSSDELFSIATEIMDMYWRVVDDGLDVLHHRQDATLELWYLRG
jgi:hypothetical protein